MVVKTITEAKARLSALVERALAGEEIIIARAGKPAVRLVPVEANGDPPRRREPGVLEGEIWIADDFDEWPRDIAVALGMVDE